MANRLSLGSRIGMGLMALVSLTFAAAQTLPVVLDDDDILIAAILKAATPVCTTLVASPGIPLVGQTYSVTATCSTNPALYVWKVNGTVVPGATAATVSLVAPAVAGNTIISVSALKGSLASAPIQTTVTTVASLASFSVSRSSVTVGSPVTVTVVPTVGTTITSLVVTNASTNAALCSSGAGGVACSWSPTGAGVTNVRAVLTLSNGQTETYLSSVAVTSAPAANTANAPIPTTTVSVGTTPGSLDVSESGAASYSIPIQASPGSGGMQPSLAMSYSSQAGNGHMGVGWNLQGLSAVTRCSKTYAQDGVKETVNYDTDATNDQFCLDGQRLIVVGTFQQTRDVVNCANRTKSSELVPITEYKTEIDSYARILSYNESPACVGGGPSRFEVYTKAGKIMSFGSRYWVFTRGYLQAPRVNNALLWVLDKVEDRLGNVMLVNYQGNLIYVGATGGLEDGTACTAAKLAAGSCVTVPNVVFFEGLLAPRPANDPAARPSLPSLGALPGVEFYPTEIVYGLNRSNGYDTANNANVILPAQAIKIEYGDRSAVAASPVVPGGANECADCSIGYDGGAGQHILTKYVKSITSLADVSYNALGDGTAPTILGGQQVRRYAPSYDRSLATNRLRLTSVSEAGADGVALPATSFNWQGSILAPVIPVNRTAFANVSALFSGVGVSGPRVADIDGDGKSDLISLTDCGGGTTQTCVKMALSSQNWVVPVAHTPLSGFNYLDANAFWDIGDFNGDGKVDIWVRKTVNNQAGSNWGVYTYQKATATFSEVATTLSGSLISSKGDTKPNFRGDFNGDGRIDMAFYDGLSTAGNERWIMYFGAPNGIIGPVYVQHPAILSGSGGIDDRVSIADVTGDGKADFMFKAVSTNTYNNVDWRLCESTLPAVPVAGQTYTLSCTPGTQTVVATPGKAPRNVVVDINGDGLADLVAPSFDNASASCTYNIAGSQAGVATRCWRICLATSDGAYSCWDQAGPATTATVPAGPTNDQLNTAADRAVRETVFGDFNGDGRTDYAAKLSPTTWTVCLSRGATISTATLYGTDSNFVPRFDCSIQQASSLNASTWPIADGDHQLGTNLLTGDFEGTGRTSILSRVPGNGFQLTTMSGQFPDLMNRVTTGLGATTDVVYAPLTDSTVYSAPTAKSYPQLSITSPMYVVKTTAASSSGLGGFPVSTYNTTYTYRDLVGVSDTSGYAESIGAGRGLLGFGSRTITDGNGIVTTMTYSQAWPTVGRPTTVTKTYGGVELNRVDNTWGTRVTGRLAGKNTTEVFLTQSIEASKELNGLALTTTTTSSNVTDYDVYGNPKVLTVTTSDGYGKVTNSTYANDATNWVLGRLMTANVSNSSPTGTVIRSSAFDYVCFDFATASPSATCSTPLQRGLLATEYVEKDNADKMLRLTTTYVYDKFGNKTSATVKFFDTTNGDVNTNFENSRIATTDWSSDGRFPLVQRNALNQEERREFDARWGSPTKVTAPDATYALFSYDGLGRKVGERLYSPGNQLLAQSSMTYATANAGYQITTKTHTGASSTAVFDNLQRQVRATVSSFNGFATSDTGYDSLGRKIWSKRPVAGDGVEATTATVVDYDILNRPTTETVLNANVDPVTWIASAPTTPSSRTATSVFTQTTYAYNIISEADPAQGAALRTRQKQTITKRNIAANGGNQVVSRETNSQGQVVRMIDANAKSTWYGYDPIGNLTKVTGPTGIIENMSYDLRGRKKGMNNPDSGSYTYAYNGAGELVKQTDANGTATVMTYDQLGRASTRNETGGVGVSSHSASWIYDGCNNSNTQGFSVTIGKLCQTTSNGGGASATSTGNTKTVSYDEHGRAARFTTQIAGVNYDTHTAYDTDGRTKYVGYPAAVSGYPLWVENSYNTYGFMNKVNDAVNATTVYWQATARYLDGASQTATVGGVTINKKYDTVGRIKNINATFGATALQTSTFAFDEMGNLTSRADVQSGLNESFAYDNLNRLTTSSGTGGAKSVTYDDSGNILTKSGITGTYGYFAGTHRVQTANGNTYGYDSNGNLRTGAGRTINYTPFNLPDSIATANVTLAYQYDAERGRTIEKVTRSTGTDTTVYIGGQFFEAVTLANGDQQSKHYIASPDGVIAVMTVARAAAGTSTVATKYWLKDHLGSIHAEMDANGANILRMSFDAWGKRRLATGADGDPNNLASFATQRGFTGHEMLDEVGLVHMNGRIYDPVLGRFMQADPIIQSPFDGQNYNRYSYVMNNPLSLTDPTGFSWWTDNGRPVARVVGAIFVSWAIGPAGFWASSGGIVGASGLASGVTAQFLSAVAGGFAAGGINGGNLNSAVQGAFSAAAFFGVGGIDALGGAGSVERSIAHAVVGCGTAAAAGGSCRSGALAAGFAEFAGPRIDVGSGDFANISKAAILGGIGSRLGGSNFANGALTGAFGYLFNQIGRGKQAPWNLVVHRGENEGRYPDNAYFVGVKDGEVYGPFAYSADPNATGTDPKCASGTCPVSTNRVYKFEVKMGFNNLNLMGGNPRELMLFIGTIDTMSPNPAQPGGKSSADFVWVHRSEGDRGAYFTNGCHVVPDRIWRQFIWGFQAGQTGTITLKHLK